jgi:hypothetical protein
MLCKKEEAKMAKRAGCAYPQRGRRLLQGVLKYIATSTKHYF